MLPPLTFTRLPNDMMGAPPVSAQNCIMHAMFIDGDETAQQAYCAAALNSIPGQKYIFDVASSKVLVTSIYAQSMGSRDPLDRERGVMQEFDVGFWSLVRARHVDNLFATEYLWLPSFLLVDTAAAMASGREIFGYPKAAATITRSGSDPWNAGVSVETLHFPIYGSQQRPVTNELIRITHSLEAGAGGLALSDIGSHLYDALNLSDLPAVELPNLPLPGVGMPQVMLRQFRDATRAGRASLKEILVVKPEPSNIGEYGQLSGGISIKILPSASHNIIQTLGIAEINHVTQGVWLAFDFTVGWARRLVP